jgi:multicomponent Na+:H+ antiporter subunit G
VSWLTGSWVDLLSSVLLLTGVALAVLAGLGLVRFPDVFSRMHAATKPATLGVLLITIGAAIRQDDGSDATKLLLVAAFQLLTAPVAAHMIGRAAYRSGTGALDDLVVDELKDTVVDDQRGTSSPSRAPENEEDRR